MKLRLSRKPAKQFSYLAAFRDRRHSKGKNVGVDFGCKSMKSYDLFATDEYYGVDLDLTALRKGSKRYPKAKPICAKIEESSLPPADFATCINVFHGTNFELASEIVVLQSIVDRVAPEGVLLVTLQRRGKIDECLDLLRRSFERVELFPYNLRNNPRTIFSLFLSAYQLFLRGPHTSDWTTVYCRCVGRL